MKPWFYRWYEKGKAYALWACPDLELIARYIQCCHILSLNIRLLLCSSVRKNPLLDESIVSTLKNYVMFLGYDNASVTFDYSTILDDLFYEPPLEIERYRSLLNDNGLFSTIDLFREYILKRNELAKITDRLENDINCNMFAVYELNLSRWLGQFPD
jgi:hypothetical protein